MHTPPLARIIVERAMLGAAVVPDRQRPNLPAESAGKLRLHGMRHQKIENRPRLDTLEPFERLRVIAYVERFAAGLRMGAHKRMRGFRLHVAGVAHLGCHLLVAGVTAVFDRTCLVVPAEYLAVSNIAGLVAFAGFGLNIWSVCQTSPNTLVSPSSLMTSRISGCSSM